MDRLKKFYLNGIIMTVVSIVIRYVSVNFNIYISNKIGTVSMGIFTLVSSVYGFALTIATSGISLATTKLVSEAMGIGSQKKDYNTEKTVRSVMKKSLLFSLSTSSATALALFILAPYLGNRLLGDERTVSSLRILAFSLPAISLSSSLSGYFTALRRVYKNACVQIFSQALRIYLCVILLSSTVAKDMESSCVAIVIGITVSELLGFLIHLVLYLIEKRKKQGCRAFTNTDLSLSKRLIPITVPVALSAYMRSALITIEHLLIPWGLERSGATRDISLASYGTLHSLVFPLILFPSSISSSFAGLLVPEISESDAASDKKRIERIINRVLKTVIIYSVGVAGIMMCLSREMGVVLLNNSDSALYISLIAPLIPIMYLDTSVDSILKGLGYQFYSMIINIADASMSVILVWLLLPHFGIMGYVITIYFTEIVNATLSITKLLIATKTKVKIFDWIVKPVLSIIISTVTTNFLIEKSSFISLNYTSLIFCISIIAVIYLTLLILLRAISPKEIKRSIINFWRQKEKSPCDTGS